MRKAARAIALTGAVAVTLLPAGRVRAVAVESRPALPPPVPCPECWVPAPVTSWQWQLSGKIDRSVDAEMYDVDMFETPSTVVGQLHAAGRRVVCYIDAGTWEDWRPDAGEYPDSVKGKPNGWPGERWLDIRRLDVLGPILEARLDRCASKGFDAVEFDNLDGYQNECRKLAPFTSAGKAVMEVEYRLRTTQFCPQANQRNFNSLKKHLRLDAYRVPCR
jgi:hypothetical protein